LNKVFIIRNIFVALVFFSYFVSNKIRQENKYGGGTTLTSNSVAQKMDKFKIQFAQLSSLTAYFKEALKWNK
jgi:hypothetical protein